ncbi:MAG: hypothetical protein ACD_37C00503G0003 [uncultured bacterium]|nr:MAG: hypothetical protein ACD_37C00503G0003 [uncultured bacterium]
MDKGSQSTSQEQLLREITKILQKSKIPYMVTGALSVIFYSKPRFSHDIDFVIEAQKKDIEKVKKAFASLPHDFIVQEDLIEDAIVNQLNFNILHLPTMIKLDFFLLKDDKFDRVSFNRRENVTAFGQKMSFTSPEDTILKKLLWYIDTKIEKHLIDAAFVYQIQKANLDKKYLFNWAKKHNTTKLLREIALINLEPHY